MSQTIHLTGTEDVRRAALTMQAAAESFNQAAANLDSQNHQMQIFLTDWLQQFREIVDKISKPTTTEYLNKG